MITGEEARRAVNEISDYCKHTQYSECYILRFCNERKYTPRIYTKYAQKYCVTLEITLPAGAATKEEAKGLVEERVKTAFPDMFPGDVSTKDVWKVGEWEEDE